MRQPDLVKLGEVQSLFHGTRSFTNPTVYLWKRLSNICLSLPDRTQFTDRSVKARSREKTGSIFVYARLILFIYKPRFNTLVSHSCPNLSRYLNMQLDFIVSFNSILDYLFVKITSNYHLYYSQKTNFSSNTKFSSN